MAIQWTHTSLWRKSLRSKSMSEAAGAARRVTMVTGECGYNYTILISQSCRNCVSLHMYMYMYICTHPTSCMCIHVCIYVPTLLQTMCMCIYVCIYVPTLLQTIDITKQHSTPKAVTFPICIIIFFASTVYIHVYTYMYIVVHVYTCF